MEVRELEIGDCFIVSFSDKKCTCIILEDIGGNYWCDVARGKKRSFNKSLLVDKITQQEFVAAEEIIVPPVVIMGEPFVFRVMVEDGKWDEHMLLPIDLVFKPKSDLCSMPCEILEEL